MTDISGFDRYLAGVELDHSTGVLKELMELLVEEFAPPFQSPETLGDAILFHLPDSEMPAGEDFLALLERAYLRFRQRLVSIQRNNTCNCRACSAVHELDLKIFVYHGEYLVGVMAGRSTFGGLGIQLLRARLMKSPSLKHKKGYAVFTDSAVAELGLNLGDAPMIEDTYPEFGTVKTSVLDLEQRYPALLEAQRRRVDAATATASLTANFSESRQTLWQWLNDPELRTRWMAGRTWTAVFRPGGRLDIGAKNHCAHGFGSIIETIVGWQPFDTFTVTTSQPSLGVAFVQTYELIETPEGYTRLNVFLTSESRGSIWLDNRILRQGLKMLYASDYRRLARLMASSASTTAQ